MNNLTRGYKKTEVGVIPDDWELKKLGDIVDFQGGSQPPLTTFIHSSKEGYIRLLQIRDYKTDKFETYIPTKFGRRFCDENDIMIGRYGPPIFQILRGLKGAYNVALIKAVPSAQINKEYAYHFLKQDILFHFIEKLSQRSSGQTGVDIQELRAYPIPVPPKAEQTAIANALSDADALITSLEKLIAKKRNIKQGAMQKLLQPKDGWEVKRLGECLLNNPDYGINAASVEYDDTLPTYLRITDISENGKYINANKVSVNNNLADSYYLDEGDIVFARTGASVGKTYLYNRNDGRLVFAGFLIRAKVNPEILDCKYLFFLTQTKYYWIWVLANSMRSGQPGLNSSEYKSFQFSLPSLSEQTRIASILSDMDNEITALENKLEKYKKIKLGMMQNLLTGRIRLI